jgi:hypothetical protein
MKSKLLGCLSAAVLGTAIAVATPAMAFRGGGMGGGGFGGMHGGFGGGGIHFGGFGGGGMHFGGMPGGGMRFGAMPGRGIFMGRSAFIPGGGRFAAAPFAGRRLAVNRFNNPFFFRNRFFFHNRFRHRFFRDNFFFVGVPFGVGWGWPYYSGCWRQVWTGYGYQWINACYDYGY